MDSYLYIFKNEIGKVKIGRSTNVEKRRKNIQSQSGMKVECIYMLENGSKYERKLHKYFEKYQTIGEWFNLPQEEIKWLSNLTINVLNERFRDELKGTAYNTGVWFSKKLKDRMFNCMSKTGYATISEFIRHCVDMHLKSEGY